MTVAISQKHDVSATRVMHRWRVAGVALALAATPLGSAIAPASATSTAPSTAAVSARHGDRPAFRQVNLVSDIPGRAQLLDKEVRNPWGIALGPTTPLWVNNQFNPASDCGSPNCVPKAKDLLTKVTLYRGANGHDPVSKVPLEVTASSPFGIVFNPTSGFVVRQKGMSAPARFLFNEVVPKGQAPLAEVTGWSNAATPPPTHTVTTRAKKLGSVQTGLALVPRRHHARSGPHLLAADGVRNVIDVYDSRFRHVRLRGSFTDPRAAAQHLSPYNVTFLGGRVYVTYAGDHQAVSVFRTDGRFIRRLVTDGPLHEPWGMAIAPRSWGRLSGTLLVGNVGDGRINAFDRRTGHLRGTLKNAAGHPLVNPGLWGLAFGNGVIGTRDTLLFAAGIGSATGGFGDDVYTHGLVGLIEPVHDDD